MKKESFRQFQSVFKAGDQSGEVYLLVKGEIGIFLPINDTKTPDFIINPNEIFGEMGVIDNELRMAEARCMVECETISMNKSEFDDQVDAANIFVRGVLGVLSKRLRQIQKPKK
ncbi:Crp/Fnr family transcriptional regulator [Alphaproteobacteria bacterium]|nr:Crp/Fnr family transcriptional regulator [Alphaproteobacteria bacterium]